MKFKLFAIVTFLLFQVCFWGQNKMKYKDVIGTVESSNPVIAYQTLQAYIKQCIEPEPELLNAYYRVSLICYKWAKEFDPLKESHDVSYFTNKAIINLDSARNNMNEKKFRKTRKYFTKLTEISDEKLRPEDILLDINEKIEDISSFKKNVDDINESFNAAADKYEQCLNLYREINSRYDEINDLYLKYDDKLEADINLLVNQFKAVLKYFDNYRKSIKSFPVKGYKQDYKLKTINIYRLDGLTSSSFFDDEVLLWDYQGWADEVKNVMANKIGVLRELISSKNNLLNLELNKKNEVRETSSDYKTINLGKGFLFAVSRFDKSLFIYKLLNYKAYKAYFINYSKSNKLLENLSSQLEILKQARYYNELLNKKQNCDTLLRVLSNPNLSNPGNYKKYKKLLTEDYGNLEGFKSYLFDENKSIKQTLNDGFKDFKNYLEKFENRLTEKDSVVKYGKIEIPLYTTASGMQEKVEPKKHYTTSIYEDRMGDLYIVGYQVYTKNSKRAFVVRTVNTEKVKWIKYFDYRSSTKKPMDDVAVDIKANQEGCCLIVHSRNDNEIKNTYIKLNAQGKKIIEKELDEKSVPRQIYLDELLGNLLIVYKGSNLIQEDKLQENLIINYYDSGLDTLYWDLTVALTGKFIELNKTVGNFYILTDFSSVLNQNGARISSKKKGIAAILIGDNGKYNACITHQSEKALEPKKMIKMDSENISIVGTQGRDEFLYLITNGFGQRKFWNIKDK